MILHMKKSFLGIVVCFITALVLSISGAMISLNNVYASSAESNELEFNVSGLMPAVLTSLNDDQTVNLEGIPAYLDYLVSNGIKSILENFHSTFPVGGSSGEHMALSVADRKSIIEAWVNASSGTDLHIQVQVGGAPLPDVLTLAEYCADNGVHSILTLPDLYFKPHSVQELVDYVELVSQAAYGIPVFYYHIPKKTQVNINMAQFVKVATERIPNFKGIKFTSTDLAEAAQVLKVLRKDQKIFLGGEQLLAPAFLLGLDTCVSPAVNLFPGLMQNIAYAVQNGYFVRANTWQDTLSAIVNDISAEGGRIPAMKVAMEFLTGIKMGPPALPIKPVSEENRRNIEDKLRNFRVDY